MMNLLFLVLMSSISLAQQQTVTLAVGQSIKLPISVHEKIRVSNRKNIKAIDQGKKLEVFGKRTGTARITVGQRIYDFRVLDPKTFNFYQNFVDQIRLLQGLSLSIDGKYFLIQGELLRMKDWLFILETFKNSPSNFVFQAQIPDFLKLKFQKKILNLLKKNGLPQVSFRYEPGPKALVNSKNKDEFRQIKKYLASIGIPTEKSSHLIALRPLVRVDVIIAEVEKSLGREIGLSWESNYQASILPKFQQQGSLFAQLKAFEAKGRSKVLASPHLLCRSGEKATFHSGGEYPIQITGYKSKRGVEWKRHGLSLEISPQADSTGQMSISISAEITLLGAKTHEDLPTIKSNKVQSSFSLNQSRTIVLSGLVRKDWDRSHFGLPWLTQIPILGHLFGSHKFQNKTSELIVFVTPRIEDFSTSTKETRLPDEFQ